MRENQSDNWWAEDSANETVDKKLSFIEQTHEDAKKLFARLGLGFKHTPKNYAPSLWVTDKEGEIIGEILLQENQRWTSNNKWMEKFIGENIEEGTDCKELAALLEIASSITALCFNEFRDTDGIRYA